LQLVPFRGKINAIENTLRGLAMKKLLLLAFLLLIFFIFACSPQAEDDYNLPGEEETADYVEMPSEIFEEAYTEYLEPVLDYEMVEIEGVMRRIMPPGSLTIEHFLEDLDYMVYVLENNFALLDVALWAHGVDYRELAENARQHIMAMEEPDEDMFLAILTYNTMPLMNTGHFLVYCQGSYRFWEIEFIHGFQQELGFMNLELMRSHLATRFYESRFQNRQDRQDRIDRHSTAVELLTETYGESINRFRSQNAFSEPVTIKMIEEERVAYVSSGFNSHCMVENRREIFSFYNEIADFEHLIIDLRGNAGGNFDVFLDILFRPHLHEAVRAPEAFMFFLDGPYIRRFGDYLFETVISGGFTLPESYYPALEVLLEHYLPEINRADIERLHYGAVAYRHEPLITPNAAMFDIEHVFNGKIWVLSDHRMSSASQLAVWYFKETGLATIVGDVSGGNLGGLRTMALMPNTGIIFQFDSFYLTDSRGRPLEAGTIPHYFNRPGMDALETVLELIAEGGY
jgi:hypothetical protein